MQRSLPEAHGSIGQSSLYSLKTQPRLLIVFLLLCLVPTTASANAGTALMWAGMLHLAFGNALIGICEGLVLARIFKLSPNRCVWVMIFANYFSSWGGEVYLNSLITQRLSLDLYNAWLWFWIMVVVTYALTLILEWPFVFFCLRKTPNRLKKSVWANLVINSFSYILIFGWYWMASPTGLYRDMNIVQPSQMTMPTNGIVFFISATDGDVYSLDFRTQKSEKVLSLGSTDKNNCLFINSSKPDTNNWDVFAYLGNVLVCSNLTVTAPEKNKVMSWCEQTRTGVVSKAGHL